MTRYEASRDTIRKAVAQLTAEGLLEPRRRRGTMVRERPRRHRLTRSRTVYRDEIGYFFDLVAQPWRALEPPEVGRGPVPFDVADLLDVEPGSEVVIRDRLMGDPATREPAQLATTYIPAALADEFPVLAGKDTGPGGIYDRMEDAGYGPIQWEEAISTPREARRLHLPSGVALLRVIRLASSPDGRPLEVNDTRMDGEPVRRRLPDHPGHFGAARNRLKIRHGRHRRAPSSRPPASRAILRAVSSAPPMFADSTVIASHSASPAVSGPRS
jgi:GntR family transcriptional regulator